MTQSGNLLPAKSKSLGMRVASGPVQLGQVAPDFLVPGMIVAEPSGQPAKVGDLIASGPPNIPVGLDIWAMATIRRPLTGGWVTLQTEMSDIEA